MTQQFKFGDRVQDADGKQFVFLRGFLSSCTVAGDDGRTYVYLTNQLQPIPHPDTVRLDWLVKNDCALTERLCDEDGDLLDTPFAVIQKQEEHFEVLAAACDIREAIDAAMREANHD
jgi:hypothetical protein|nr:MAG TPA: hypothetical protein [Caudoviricetes sp.]